MTFDNGQVIQQLLSSDNTVRAEAQRWLETLDLVSVSKILIDVLSSSGDAELRGLAAVALRNRVRNLKLQESVSGEPCSSPAALSGGTAHFHGILEDSSPMRLIQETIAPQILSCFVTETNCSVRRRTAATVATTADFFEKNGYEWEALSRLIQDWLFYDSSSGVPADQQAKSSLEQHIAILSLITALTEHSGSLQFLGKQADLLVNSFRTLLACCYDVNLTSAVLSTIASIEDGITEMDAQTFFEGDTLTGNNLMECKSLKVALRELAPVILKRVEDYCGEEDIGKRISKGAREEIFSALAQLTNTYPGFWFGHVQELHEVLLRFIASSNSDSAGMGYALRIVFVAASSVWTERTGVEGDGPKLMACSKQKLLNSLVQLFFKNLDAPAAVAWNAKDSAVWEADAVKHPVSVDHDSKNSVDNLIYHVCSFVRLCASEDVDAFVVNKLVTSRLSQQASVSFDVVVSCQLVCEIAQERPEAVNRVASSLFCQLIDVLKRSFSDARARWWALRSCREILEKLGPQLLREQIPVPDMWSILIKIVQEDPSVPCKLQAINVVYTSISLEEINEGFLRPCFLDAFMKAIIDLPMNDEEMQQTSLATVLKLAELSSQWLEAYYDDLLGMVNTILTNSIDVRTRPRPTDTVLTDRRLCATAANLGIKLCTVVPVPSSEKDQASMANLTISLLEAEMAACLQEDHSDNVLTQALLIIFGDLVEVMKERFVEHCPRCTEVLLRIFDLPEKAASSVSDDFKCRAEMRETSVQSEGDKNTQEEQGTESSIQNTLQCGCGGETVNVKNIKKNNDHVIEFNTNVILDKASALNLLKLFLQCFGDYLVPFISKIIDVSMREVRSTDFQIRELALNVLPLILPCCLPSDTEASVPYEESRCALRKGVITLDSWFKFAQSILTPLLVDVVAVSTESVMCYMKAVGEVLYTFLWGIHYERERSDQDTPFCPEGLNVFLDRIFSAYGERLVKTLTEELESAPLTAASSASVSHTKKSVLGSLSSNCQDDPPMLFHDNQYDWKHDPEGLVYTIISYGIRGLFKIFGGSHCTQRFIAHLHTPFTGLLALPEANMMGRISALRAYGALMEFGALDTIESVAGTILPVCFLYARCNDVHGENGEDVDDKATPLQDVERIRHACYCIGIISQKAPTVFRRHFDTALKTLTNVLNHSESLSTDRRAATDYSVGALIKVYMNPAYQDLAYPIITSTSPTFNGSYSLVELLSKWFQFDDDDIQSFTIVNMWVQVILDKDLPHPLAEMSAYNMRLLKEDKVGALLCIALLDGFIAVNDKIGCRTSCDVWIHERTRHLDRLRQTLDVIRSMEEKNGASMASLVQT